MFKKITKDRIMAEDKVNYETLPYFHQQSKPVGIQDKRVIH